MPITEEKFRELQLANPGVDLAVLTHDRLPDEVLIRVPLESQYTIYRNLQVDGQLRQASVALIEFATLFATDTDGQMGDPSPSAQKAKLQAQLAAHPGLVEVWASEIVEHAGYTRGARRKKF